MSADYRASWFHRYDDDGIIPLFTYKDYEGMTEKPFSCEVRPGDTLRGHFYAKTVTKSELVFFCHGLGGGHLNYMAEINELCTAGYEVLAVDYFGCYESDGDSIRCLGEAVADVDACLKELAQTDSRPLILMGHSWGAWTAGVVLSLHPEIQKAVLLAPFDSPVDFARSFFPQEKNIAETALALEKEYHTEWAESSLAELLQRVQMPVLIAASLDDPLIPIMSGLIKIQRAFKSENIRFITLQGKGHNPTYTERAAVLGSQFVTDYQQKIAAGILETLEEKKAYVDQYNFAAICEQDGDFWQKVFDFLS